MYKSFPIFLFWISKNVYLKPLKPIENKISHRAQSCYNIFFLLFFFWFFLVCICAVMEVTASLHIRSFMFLFLYSSCIALLTVISLTISCSVSTIDHHLQENVIIVNVFNDCMDDKFVTVIEIEPQIGKSYSMIFACFAFILSFLPFPFFFPFSTLTTTFICFFSVSFYFVCSILYLLSYFIIFTLA